MAAGMTPPLGLALAAFLFRNRFTLEEHEASKAALVLGMSFITEGAIPFAARYPFRISPCITVGSAVTRALSMALGSKLLPYVTAIVAGTAVTMLGRSLSSRTLFHRRSEHSEPAV